MLEGEEREAFIRETKWMRLAGTAALALLAAFLLVLTVGKLWELKYVGSGVPASNTINVSGMGEVFAVPDTATFSVTVRERAKEVSDAQETATEKANAIYEYLKGEGIEEKDIKTTDYNVYPQYEWQQAKCTDSYCPPGKQILTGFEVSQTFSVKVRDTEKAGDLLSGVGSRGASEVSGLSFTIDDEDQLKEEARGKAIAEAKEKANVLARELGVRVVRVVGFYEESGGYYPVAYGRGGAAMDMVANEKAMAAPAPSLPSGENKITSNVNITYEIR